MVSDSDADLALESNSPKSQFHEVIVLNEHRRLSLQEIDNARFS